VPVSEHRAVNFFELTKSVLNTCEAAVQEVIRTKTAVSEEDCVRIFSILRSHLPQMERIYLNLCRHCPAYTLADELGHHLSRSRYQQASQMLQEVAAFVGFLLHQLAPPKDQVFLLSMAEVSPAYQEIEWDGRQFFDQRVKGLIEANKHGEDRLLYLGAGIFLFFFSRLNDPPIAVRKRRIIEIVLTLVGRNRGRAPLPAASAESAVAEIESAFVSDADLEQQLRRTVADHLAPMEAPGGGAADVASLRSFQPADWTRLVSFQYEPVWDATTETISIYQLVARRLAGGDDGATPSLRSYGFQIARLNQAVSSLLAFSVKCGGEHIVPSVLVPLSLFGLWQGGSDALRGDLLKVFVGYEGTHLIAVLTDIDDCIPRNYTRLVVEELRRRNVRIFCRTPFAHNDLDAIWKAGETCFELDLDDVQRLGFDASVTTRIVAEFARSAKLRNSSSMLSGVNHSQFAEAAQKSGFRYLAGRVVGRSSAEPVPVREVSRSAILLRA